MKVLWYILRGFFWDAPISIGEDLAVLSLDGDPSFERWKEIQGIN